MGLDFELAVCEQSGSGEWVDPPEGRRGILYQKLGGCQTLGPEGDGLFASANAVTVAMASG